MSGLHQAQELGVSLAHEFQHLLCAGIDPFQRGPLPGIGHVLCREGREAGDLATGAVEVSVVPVQLVGDGDRVDQGEFQAAGGGDVPLRYLGHARVGLEIVAHGHVDATVARGPLAQCLVLAEAGARLGGSQADGVLLRFPGAPPGKKEDDGSPYQAENQDVVSGVVSVQACHVLIGFTNR